MKKIKDISIGDYKPISSLMIDRHYYFDIKIIYENDSKVINKRYSAEQCLNHPFLSSKTVPSIPLLVVITNLPCPKASKSLTLTPPP